MSNIKYPFVSSFKSKKGMYTWNYKVDEDGFVGGMWRSVYVSNTYRAENDRRRAVACGGYREKEIRVPESKECLKDIERKLGRITDGWRWVK